MRDFQHGGVVINHLSEASYVALSKVNAPFRGEKQQVLMQVIDVCLDASDDGIRFDRSVANQEPRLRHPAP